MEKVDKIVQEIDETYIKINVENWRKTITENLDTDDKVIAYLNEYVEKNTDILNYSWAKNFRKFFILYQESAYEDYIRIYFSSLKDYPDNYCVELAMGEYYYTYAAKIIQSREHYKKAESLFPDISKPKAQLSLIYSALGDSEKAYKYCEKAYEISRDEQIAVVQIQSQSLLNMAVILLHSGKRHEGRDLLRRALKIRPDYGYARQLLRTT